jgi:hypothetical protein
MQKLIKIFITAVIEKSPIKNSKYAHNKKYELEDYVIGILDILKNNSSWNSYSGIINGNTLRKKHYEWIKLGIYEKIYKKSLNEYFKKIPKTAELKYQSIDSTFIKDVNGSKESNYNATYKGGKGSSLKGIKVTSIVTAKGIPISVNVDSGNVSDLKTLPKALDNIIIECDTKKYSTHNRYKQYFLGDPGYDSKANHRILNKRRYKPIIKYNRRNTKNPKLFRDFDKQQSKIYKKRIIIENYHSWLKKFVKIRTFNEKKIYYFKGLLLLAISVIINRRIWNNS